MTSKETPKTPPRGGKRNPALPENLPDHPILPGIEPAKPVPSFDPETAAMLERMRQALEANTARMALPAVAPQEIILSPAMLKAIESRAMERVAPVLMQILSELRAAATLAQSLPAQLKEAGETARVEIIHTGATAQYAARLASAETRHAVEALNRQSQEQITAMHTHARLWTRGLTRYAKWHLQDTAGKAVEGMSAATAEIRGLTDQLGVTASTIEECSDAILYVAPALTQHHEVRTRSLIRSAALATTAMTFAGLAAVMGGLWWAGVLH